MQRRVRPVLGADVRDDQLGSGKRHVHGSGEEGRRQDGHHRHRPDHQDDRANGADLSRTLFFVNHIQLQAIKVT